VEFASDVPSCSGKPAGRLGEDGRADLPSRGEALTSHGALPHADGTVGGTALPWTGERAAGALARAFRPEQVRDPSCRPAARARFLQLDGDKQYIRGVTYGTFADGEPGVPYPDAATVSRDFAAIAASGGNAVRLYTAPPRWLLDLAHENGIVVMVGLAWEEHVALLDDRKHAARIVDRIEEDADACAGHPALLCFAVGNEIPSSIVRWHGSRRIERFIERLYSTVKGVDPEALVTYVNYPSTEYLQLPFLDLVCFNVYLESEEPFHAYLAHLHNLAGERPLLITELGLDSRRHGEDVQARALERQLQATYASGCAGAFVFAWTDEWHRGGVDVDDWNFGLVDRRRRPKPALAAIERAFAKVPLPRETALPRISVVVCTHNGEATIGTCLGALCRLDYPDFEVIVVDDGSTDRTAEIAADFDLRLIRTTNRGLSSARNTGLVAAVGEIVAFTDDDAWPDRDWLRYLAIAFASGNHVGIGGPNLPPEDAGVIERAVALAPGGPTHVLLTDQEAEHIPGCNMAFRREALEAVGGFDPQFTIAGDDVDICWRLQQRGWTIGFSPAAVVHHRRRRSVRAYLRQQAEYGKAEALLERKWPEKYNRGGHLAWGGSMYGGLSRVGRRRPRIGYGTWGSNLFQSVYDRTPSTLGTLPLTPEWYLVLGVLALLSVVGIFEKPLVPWTAGAPVRVELLLLAAAGAALAVKALQTVWRAPDGPRARGVTVRSLTTVLHALQPAARLVGRLRYGLTPWRRRGELVFAMPWPRRRQVWSERWRSQGERLLELERDLLDRCMTVRRGGDFDRWDIHVRVGPLAAARVRVAVEEHGHGRQLIRYRVWPRWSRLLPAMAGLLTLWLAGSVGHDPYLALAVGGTLVLVLLRALREAGASVAVVLRAIERGAKERPESRNLLDDLRVVPRPSLTVIESLTAHRNGSHGHAAEPSEAFEQHV
jgi:GT2 family glycosyltransferase